MNDYYLKFSDEAQALEALRAAGMTTHDGEGVERIMAATHEYALDVVGTVFRQTGYMKTVHTPMGEVQVPEQAPSAGWHVNLRMIEGELPAALVTYSIPAPAAPKRVWA